MRTSSDSDESLHRETEKRLEKTKQNIMDTGIVLRIAVTVACLLVRRGLP